MNGKEILGANAGPSTLQKRNTNVDVFRCMLMFLIVLHHSYVRGPWYANGALWTLWFSTFIHWHVDGFIGISGWFGIDFKWRKFVRLWVLMAFYGCLLFFVGRILKVQDISFSLNFGGWFGGSYLALMFCAPFLNRAIDGMVTAGKRAVLSAWGMCAIMMTLTWCPGHLFTGVNANHVSQFSFTTMVFVYCTGRLVRVMFPRPLSLKVLLLGPLVFLGTILVIGGGKTLLQVYRGKPHGAAAWDFLTVYNAPHVWVMAISMLLIFAWHVKCPLWLGRVCSFLAPSMFSVYLIHEVSPLGRCAISFLEQCPPLSTTPVELFSLLQLSYMWDAS